MGRTLNQTRADFNDQRRQIDEVLAAEATTRWERDFCASLLEWLEHRELTVKQGSVLDRIWNQRCAPRRGADLASCARDLFSGRYRSSPTRPRRRA